ncbi:M24 family metallopeptidase [Sphingomonas changnyeongensis]|uniref:M24 family metallopeptidase n=1 Tax=Sphingomonas changnyeongensis TaxID=2698679 RepID=A0A7Z2S5V7_9SPHN|nr:Xaa-Pro peptidase family protein [Sphingomonas changnyeongensis]QHL91545.1 M24 family metallopeptidase [Sphingomonas changnyeongensis]
MSGAGIILSRRAALGGAAALGVGLLPGRIGGIAHAGTGRIPGDTAIRAAAPIAPAERLARIARVQAAMARAGVGALLVEAGSTLRYFTGINWWRSERLTAAVIPVEGPVAIVTPFFEEPSIREMLAVPGDVRVWQEDENPHALVAGWLRDLKLAGRPVAVEETTRFFAVDGLQRALPDVRIGSGAALVNGCRMIKSPAEIALMQRASDIVIAAYRATAPQVQAGMDGAQIFQIMRGEIARRGGETPSGGVEINEGSALPHGSRERQTVREGSVILMDCGCTVDGYHADISRTFVFGTPDRAQREMFANVRRGQDVAMAAARIGVPAGQVDDAVRREYERLGYGPGYRLPGLSHRTGHGIGMDVHEPVNLVHGETTPLQPGMCFSNEPGLYAPGRYGIRIEDCFYMTDSGPRYFSEPPPSLDDPFA